MKEIIERMEQLKNELETLANKIEEKRTQVVGIETEKEKHLYYTTGQAIDCTWNAIGFIDTAVDFLEWEK